MNYSPVVELLLQRNDINRVLTEYLSRQHFYHSEMRQLQGNELRTQLVTSQIYGPSVDVRTAVYKNITKFSLDTIRTVYRLNPTIMSNAYIFYSFILHSDLQKLEWLINHIDYSAFGLFCSTYIVFYQGKRVWMTSISEQHEEIIKLLFSKFKFPFYWEYLCDLPPELKLFLFEADVRVFGTSSSECLVCTSSTSKRRTVRCKTYSLI